FIAVRLNSLCRHASRMRRGQRRPRTAMSKTYASAAAAVIVAAAFVLPLSPAAAVTTEQQAACAGKAGAAADSRIESCTAIIEAKLEPKPPAKTGRNGK